MLYCAVNSVINELHVTAHIAVENYVYHSIKNEEIKLK